MPALPLPAQRRGLVPSLALVLVLLVGACGGGDEPAGGDGPRVVTTTTIFADLVRQVGGSRVTVDSIVPRGGEVHTFDPTPSDVRRVTEADVVFLNGLGLDEWLGDLVRDAGTSAPVVELGEDLEGVTLLEGGAHEDEEAPETTPGDEHEGEDVNPHVWMNVAYASLYAGRIAETLAEVDPDGAQAYADGLAAYQRVLADLDDYARTEIGGVPEARRTVVAFHDAFPYFAAAYGLTIDGTIVDAPGQDPSAGEIASLVAAIRANNVTAILAEAQFSEDLVNTVAAETDAVVVSNLYSDSVGDAPQDTYEGLMRWNVDQLTAALRN